MTGIEFPSEGRGQIFKEWGFLFSRIFWVRDRGGWGIV